MTVQIPEPKPLPDHIKKYAFDFHWSNEKLWQLDLPITQIHTEELLWHFDIPWLHTADGRFNLKPVDVMNHPDTYPKEYARTMRADINYPIDIMFNKDRWLILDGLHRLMQLASQGKREVTVRKVPREYVPIIRR